MDENPSPAGHKLRVMLDANVLFAGTLWPRFPYEVLRHAVAGDYQLVLSSGTLHEARTHIARYNADFTAQLDALLELTDYEEVASPSVEEIDANLALVRDPKDVHVALAAMNAQVDALVSQDKDFTDPDAPARRYLTILLPGTFLQEYLGWSHEALEAIRKRNWSDMDEMTVEDEE